MALIDTPLLQLVLSALSTLTNKMLLAALTFLLGAIISRMLGKLTAKILKEIELDLVIKRLTGIETALTDVFSIAVSIFFYGLTSLLVLKILGVNVFVIETIGILIIAIMLLSILIALQHSIPNIAAGIGLRQRKIVMTGDYLKLRNISGIVTHMGLFEITLVNKDKEIIYIPNRALIAEKHFSVKRHH
ncbi:MAG TPA: mechanosensitive ion channel domain-containing protein [Candidatus Nanoarchaeia archaeon]|nr:mechanosensitive ion channel domain-containing protein [Candidatus Nanoarchaeia archaeon]